MGHVGHDISREPGTDGNSIQDAETSHGLHPQPLRTEGPVN